MRTVSRIGLWAIACSIFCASAHGADESDYIRQVELNDQSLKVFLHLDNQLNPAPGFDARTVQNSLRAGDQLVVRWYPSKSFHFIDANPPSPGDASYNIILPGKGSGVPVVPSGLTTITYAAKGSGGIRVRVSDSMTEGSAGSDQDGELEVPLASIASQLEQRDPTKSKLDPRSLPENAYPGDWKLYELNVSLNHARNYIELFKKSGDYLLLVDRDTIDTRPPSGDPMLISSVDGGAPVALPMTRTEGSLFFEAVVPITAAGVYDLNVVVGSPSASAAATRGRVQGDRDYRLLVSRVRDLPGSFRVRLGAFSHNRLREVRLGVNLLLVLHKQSYFRDKTPFLQRFNPIVGFPLGDNGIDQEQFFFGVSVKAITEADVNFGVLLGTKNNEPWRVKDQFYIGFSVDPALFGRLQSQR